ncbi:MAG: Cas9 inhibitor AcrIIA9 family protein, partial [Candidatus Cryptobacteroides sp.]
MVSPAFFTAIESFIMQKMEANDLFAKKVCNPQKNLDDCITYILNTVQTSGYKGFADDEIYS